VLSATDLGFVPTSRTIAGTSVLFMDRAGVFTVSSASGCYFPRLERLWFKSNDASAGTKHRLRLAADVGATSKQRSPG
jgi:hypothetical protein